MRSQQHFGRPEMGNALLGSQRKFSIRKEFNDFLKSPPCSLTILGVLQMPIGHRIKCECNVLRSVPWLGTKSMDGQFSARNIFEVLGLNLSEQHQPFEICGKAIQLFTNFSNSFQVFPLLLSR